MDKGIKYEEIAKDIIKNNNLNFDFYKDNEALIILLIYLTSKLIEENKLHTEHEDNKSVVYLTLCSLAILFNLPKEEYKILFEELRLRNVYKYLKPSILLYNYVSELIGSISNKMDLPYETTLDMFKYLNISTPLIISLESLSRKYDLIMDDFITTFSQNRSTFPLDYNLNIGSVNVRNFYSELYSKIIDFNTEVKSIKKIIKSLKEFEYTEIFPDSKKAKNTKQIDNKIKKYSEFELVSERESENRYVELERKWGSLGNYIENIAKEIKDNDAKLIEFRQILGEYLDSEPTINIANAVDLINKYDQRLLVNDIEENIFESQIVDEFIEDVTNVSIAGKSCFNSFLKSLHAIKLGDIEENTKDVPKNFFKYYTFDNLNKEELKRVFSRFKSLDNAYKLMETINSNIVGLYFGIKDEGNKFKIEYGVLFDGNRNVLGEFNFNSSDFKSLLNKKNKALKPLQDSLSKYNLKELKYLSKIKSDFLNFNPGIHTEKTNIYVKDNVLNIGFYGLGKWSDGIIDEESLKTLKYNFKKWISNNKWKNEILISVKADKFWVYYKIKLDK